MDQHSPENCTCFNLRKAMRAVTQMYDDALKPTGLRATQMPLLAHLNARTSVTMTELANLLGMDRTTLTRNLRPLMTQGLVAPMDGEDKRQRPVAITPAGRAKLRDAIPLWTTVQDQLVSRLGTERWTGLIGDLEAAVDAAHGKR